MNAAIHGTLGFRWTTTVKEVCRWHAMLGQDTHGTTALQVYRLLWQRSPRRRLGQFTRSAQVLRATASTLRNVRELTQVLVLVPSTTLLRTSALLTLPTHTLRSHNQPRKYSALVLIITEGPTDTATILRNQGTPNRTLVRRVDGFHPTRLCPVVRLLIDVSLIRRLFVI